ncbi:9303_t:CDS:10 [Entrophospora sp. SA101]|nr:9303_t:CDS:10 [Entrophospora sp. SA101]
MSRIMDNNKLEQPFFIHHFYTGPVTSLCFHNNEILLSGQGPYLKVFYVPTGELLINFEVLKYFRIHKIKPVKHTKKFIGLIQRSITQEQRLFAICGSKTIQIIEIKFFYNSDNPPECKISLISKLSPLKDWIHDIQWLYDENDESDENNFKNPTELAMAFAHNFVEIFDYQTKICLYSVKCEETSIIYSARFFGDTKNDLILASGTVFNQILLWKMMGDKNKNGDSSIFKRLIGHEVIIFSVRFNKDGKFLSSVSDDRTIRIWKTAKDDNNPPLVLYGHMARVWDCYILDDYLISISEATGGGDSGIRFWSLMSITNNKIDSEQDLIKISLPNIQTYSTCDENVDRNHHQSREFFRNFVLVNYYTIVISTNHGHDHELNEWTSLFHSEDLQNYTMMKASNCGRVFCCGSIDGQVFVISVNKEFKTIKRKLHEYKVFEIFLEDTNDSNVFYIISHAVHNDIILLKLDLNQSNNDQEPIFKIMYRLSVPPRFQLKSLSLYYHYNLLICGSRESGLAIYSLTSSESSSLQRLEDKKDDDAKNMTSTTTTMELSPIIYLRKIHGKQAVTSIAIKMEKDGSYNKYRLRGLNMLGIKSENINSLDGKDNSEYGIPKKKRIGNGELLVKDNKLIIEQVYKAKITKGWLEKVVFIDNELFLLGFYRKRFFVYNEFKKFEIFSVACGGAHRIWHFKANDKKMNKASFMFIRKENVFIYSRERLTTNEGFNECKLQEDFHGRECRIVKFLPYPIKTNFIKNQEIYNDPIIFATGAEDNIPNEKDNRLICLCSIKKHKSVIRSLEWSYGNEILLFSSGANEELRCWKVEISLAKVQLTNNQYKMPLVNINCLEWSSCPSVSQIPETRIMDTTVYSIAPNQGLHLIIVVYSDSVLRKFALIEGSNDLIIVITSATDGRIAIWEFSKKIYSFIDSYISKNNSKTTFTKTTKSNPTTKYSKDNDFQNIEDLGKPNYYYQAHQSGVDCFDFHQLSSSSSSLKNGQIIRYMIVSGGDDNSIMVKYVDFCLIKNEDNKLMIKEVNDEDDDFDKFKTLKFDKAHASSIQGIYIMSNTKILSTSLDQRPSMTSKSS